MSGIYGSSGSGALIPIKRCEVLQNDDSTVPRRTAADASDYTYGLSPNEDFEYSFESENHDSSETREFCFGTGDQKLKAHNFPLKFPPTFCGSETWFTYEKDVLEWCEITTAEGPKRGPLLKLGMRGPSVSYKEEFEKDRLADPILGSPTS